MSAGCELCVPADVILVPKRRVADFFDMSAAEQGSVLALRA